MRQRYDVIGHGKPCPYETNRRGMACRALLLLSRARPYLQALLLIVLYVALADSSPEVSHAQEGENHAGLVVQFGDGTTNTYCLPFTGESITGIDLLLKTGLDITAETQGALGAWVCRIGPDGCNYPGESCVCQSYGPGGRYWVYNHLVAGTWKASSKGASNYKVRDGEVEGWAWSSGKGPSVAPSFSELCAGVLPPQPEPTATNPPPATNMPLPLPTNTTVTVPPTSTLKPPVPTSTLRPRLTSTPAPVPPTEQAPQPPLPTATQELPTITATILPTDTPAPTATPTLEPTSTHAPTPIPSSTATMAPSATPTTIIQAAGPTSQGFAQMLALGIGLAVVGGLALWWFGLRGRRL